MNDLASAADHSEAHTRYDVFLSHSKNNPLALTRLRELLYQSGRRVWVDDEQIESGDNLRKVIEQGLKDSAVLFFLLSAESLQSEWATYELELKRRDDPNNLRKSYLLIRIDNSIPPPELRRWHYVDWQDLSDDTYYFAIEPFSQEEVREVKPTIVKSPLLSNDGYVGRTTFLFAGGGGTFFALAYVLELLLLWLNRAHVRGPDALIVLLTSALSYAPSSATWWEGMYDLASWIVDFKKLYTYGILAFWCLIFARFACRYSSSPISFKPTNVQSIVLRRLFASRQSRLLPFVVNVIIAIVLACVFSREAMLPFSLGKAGDSSLWEIFFSPNQVFRSTGFLLYRLAAPVLLCAVLLHFVIALQLLCVRGTTERGKDPIVSRFGLATAAALAIMLGADWLIRSVIDSTAWNGYQAVQAQRGLAFALIAFCAVVFFRFRPDKPFARLPRTRHTALPSLLLALCWPILTTIAPFLAVLWILGGHVAVAPPSGTARPGLLGWLHDGCIKQVLVIRPREVMITTAPPNAMRSSILIGEIQRVVGGEIGSGTARAFDDIARQVRLACDAGPSVNPIQAER